MEIVFVLGYLFGMILSLLIDIIFRIIEGDIFEDDRQDN